MPNQHDPAKRFQSTHSLRSATDIFDGVKPEAKVSIHALLAECDKAFVTDILAFGKFQSTHSLRSATVDASGDYIAGLVSIHALLAECDS